MSTLNRDELRKAKALLKSGMKRADIALQLGRHNATIVAALKGLPYAPALTTAAKVIKRPKEEALDVVERHRYQTEIKRLKDVEKTLTQRLSAAEEHRSSILGIAAKPTILKQPALLKPRGRNGRQAVVLHISDSHFGEVVNRDEVMGVNEYNPDIAKRRMGRLFDVSANLTTHAWPRSDDAPTVVHVLLGGDLVSGHGLHPELAETDSGTAYEQCKMASNSIAAGVLRLHFELLEFFGRPILIELISVPGNHGRSTYGKPRAKLASLQSYDTLVADFIEAALRTYPTITHRRGRAFDAYFGVVGHPCLLTHGDRMSAGGGTGFIGPAANIVKGHKKIMLTEQQQRRPVRFIFSGHFHTTQPTPWGFGNGSGVGYSEFGKSIRGDAEPAQQNYIVFHERYGMIRWQPINVGHPDEGSIYQPQSGLILPTAA